MISVAALRSEVRHAAQWARKETVGYSNGVQWTLTPKYSGWELKWWQGLSGSHFRDYDHINYTYIYIYYGRISQKGVLSPVQLRSHLNTLSTSTTIPGLTPVHQVIRELTWAKLHRKTHLRPCPTRWRLNVADTGSCNQTTGRPDPIFFMNISQLINGKPPLCHPYRGVQTPSCSKKSQVNLPLLQGVMFTARFCASPTVAHCDIECCNYLMDRSFAAFLPGDLASTMRNSPVVFKILGFARNSASVLSNDPTGHIWTSQVTIQERLMHCTLYMYMYLYWVRYMYCTHIMSLT